MRPVGTKNELSPREQAILKDLQNLIASANRRRITRAHCEDIRRVALKYQPEHERPATFTMGVML